MWSHDHGLGLDTENFGLVLGLKVYDLGLVLLVLHHKLQQTHISQNLLA